MANIWKQQKDVNEHPNRNNFDLSKKSNISMKFGTLYPVYCQPVVPGDSFSIDTAFNLKLMPVLFPVQTKMRAHMHYFYVRNKNLWSNWENWISNLVGQSDHPHPYISVLDSKFKNGSIHDFLGVPTSLVVNSDHYNLLRAFPLTIGLEEQMCIFYSDNWLVGEKPLNPTLVFDSTVATKVLFILPNSRIGNTLVVSTRLKDFFSTYGVPSSIVFARCSVPQDARPTDFPPPVDYFDFERLSPLETVSYSSGVITLSTSFVNQVNSYLTSSSIKDSYYAFAFVYPSNVFESEPVRPVLDTFDQYSIINSFVDPSVQGYEETGFPLYSQYLHINALPYRAYESIYYTYYNNNVLNPLKIGGVPQYNRYNTNLGDGADTTDYHLFQRNYELDFLTSALPSPQQGVAPVVGMTALGDITIEDENGITTAHAEIDNDGTITKVILTSPAASIEHARTAMNIAACGMSISDFRQTNALTRFLETNIRKGYRYMDFIAGHFGKEPEYRELDLPEFIGGFSRDVSVSTVVSNADTLGDDSGKALGAYGGYAQVVGGGKSSIRHYCDDYGFIIGILSVVPTPCYSQLLPKHMVAPDNFLDYYFPEFSSSGLQPITYKEVAPIQSYIDSLIDPSKSLEDTFGYQRPNYDLVSAVDEVHGEFRDSLRNYVINRIFDSRPELGQSFISINPSEINDIFVNTNPDDDCIIGEIGFAVHAKRPIPRVVIPNLGK